MVATLLILLGVVLTPVAIVSGRARVLLSDTDSFVSTYGPLIGDAQMQDFLADEVADAIDQRIDIDGTVGDVIDGLSELTADRPRAQAAIQALHEPAAQGIRSTIRGEAERIVSSAAFAEAWRESLRALHSQATGVLADDGDLPVSITEEGLGLQLAPLIALVRDRLVEQGFTLAEKIPEVDRTVVLVPASSLSKAQTAYDAVLTTGIWLGLVVLALLIGGVLVSNRRRLTAVWAAVGLAVGAVVVLAGTAVGRHVVLGAVPADVMPDAVVQLTFDALTGAVRDLAFATLVLAVIVGVISWVSGPFRAAVGVRRAYADFAGAVRARGDAYGLSPGTLGTRLYGWRVALRVAVAVIAGLVLVLNRPISTHLVVVTACVSLFVLLVLSLLERPEPAPTAS